MKTLFEAIYSHWLSEGKLGLTQLYNTEGDDDAVFPYGVFSLPSVIPEDTFTEEGESCLIQFNLFSEETLATEICAIFELLKTAFDKRDLSIEDYETVSLTRESANMIRIEKVWQYNVTYNIVIQKTE